MIKRLSILACFLTFCFTTGWSQCISGTFEDLDVNKVRARLYNGGDMFWDLIGNPRYEVPQTNNPADSRHSLFAASLWMGGVDPAGGLHVAAQTYRQQGNDYFPGPFRDRNIPYECDSAITFPATPGFENGMMLHSGGKNLVFFNGSYSIYDPASLSQLQKFHLTPKAEYGHVELPDGRVLLFGDPISNYPNPTPTMVLDSANFNNAAGPTLNYFHRFSQALVLSNGKVLISGITGAELFDPVTNTSDTILPPAINRHSHAMVQLPDGRVLISGGTNASLNPNIGIKSTELYDPVNGTWSAGPDMSIDRTQHSMVLLPSGKVLIFGGGKGAFGISVDLFDPGTNTLTTAGFLNYKAGATVAIPLNNGNIFLAYRDNDANRPLTTLYDTLTHTAKDLNYVNLGSMAVSQADGYILTQWGYGPDFHRYDPITNSLKGQRWQRLWKVSRAQINAFIADQANNTINWANYPDIRDWPAHGDTLKGEDFHLAPFVDVNQDGLYQPWFAGDYPCIQGDQALWWIFNDAAAPHTETGGLPLHVQVEAMAYAYDCGQTNCPDTAIDYSTFYHFEIQNKSKTKYEDFHLGFWTDTDIGGFFDDYVGCDTLLDLAYGYNGDAFDEGPNGYGDNPPAIGTVTLNSPDSMGMTSFVYYENDFSQRGNPENAQQYYNYLRAVWKDGTPMVNNGINGYSATAPGPRSHYIYPGDPGCDSTGQGSGWSEASAMNQPFDRRYLTGTGPATFEVGDTLQFDYAIIWSRNTDTSQTSSGNLASVCKLKTEAPLVRNFWLNQSKGCFNLTVGVEPPVQGAGPQISLYPNPNQGSFTLEGEAGKRGAYTIYDLFGRKLSSGLLIGKQRFENFARGVYVVEARYGNQRIAKKVVVH